jgi:hypothetical protein
VDERIFRKGSHVPGNPLHPNGYLELGQEWHSKLALRAELTGVAINGYNTGIEGGRKMINKQEVDYWFGGLVTVGVAPQPEGGPVPGTVLV